MIGLAHRASAAAKHILDPGAIESQTRKPFQVRQPLVFAAGLECEICVRVVRAKRTLATLLQGGIPLVGALEVAREASGNRVIGESIRSATTQVREGKPLSDS